MAINNMNGGKAITPEDINIVIGVDHRSKKVGGSDANVEFTKAELTDKFEGLNSLFDREEKAPADVHLIRDLESAQAFFTMASETIESALARLTVVSTASVLGKGAAS